MSLPCFSIAVECRDHVTFFNRRKNPLNIVLSGRTTGGNARREGAVQASTVLASL